MFITLIAKDIKEEMRRKHELAALFSLTAALALPTSYAISGPGSVRPQDAPFLVVLAQQAVSLIITTVLGFVLVLREAERGTIYAMKLAPIPPEVTVASKITSLFLFLVPFNLVFALLTSFFSSEAFLSQGYLIYVFSLSLYMASLGALVSFMIIYTDAGTLLSSVALAALSAPFLFSTLPQAVDALKGAPGAPFLMSSVTFAFVSTVLGKFLIEI